MVLGSVWCFFQVEQAKFSRKSKKHILGRKRLQQRTLKDITENVCDITIILVFIPCSQILMEIWVENPTLGKFWCSNLLKIQLALDLTYIDQCAKNKDPDSNSVIALI